MEEINIFYSTTEDAGMQKYTKSFRKVVDQVCRILDVRPNVIYWRDLAGKLASAPGKKGQDVIDARVAGKYDVYIGVMGSHFGRGTDNEYLKAVKAHLKDRKPASVFFGFCEEAVNPYSLDPKSLAKLLNFRRNIGEGKKYKIANLYFTFANDVDFKKRIEVNLKHAIGVIKERVAGGRKFKT